MIDYTAILTRRYAGKQWILDGDDYTGLTWLDNSAKPSKATLDGLWAEVQQEIANEAANKLAKRQAVLDKIGLTADEAAALLGQFGNIGDLDRLRNNTRQYTYRQSTSQKHDVR